MLKSETFGTRTTKIRRFIAENSTCIKKSVMTMLFTFQLQSLALSSDIPNGLCLVMAVYGRCGHGFLIENQLLSAAHVLDHCDGRILCHQNGQLIDITSRRTNKIVSHPEYLNRDISIEAAGQTSSLARSYDLSVMSLTIEGPSLSSDFVLDPSPDIAQSARLQDGLGLASVVRLQDNGTSETFTAVNDLFAAKVTYLPTIDKLFVEGALETANTYLEHDMPIGPGDSGSPVVLPIKVKNKPKFLVVGVVTGTYREIVPDPEIPQSYEKPPTVIAPSIHFANWLSKTNPNFFLQPAKNEMSQNQSCAKTMGGKKQ